MPASPTSLVTSQMPDTTVRTSPVAGGSWTARALYHAARLAQRRSVVHTDSDLKRTTGEQVYRAWRMRELHGQLHDGFDVARIAGRDVLDFGCGTGELCTLLGACQPRSLCGLDKSADAIRQATRAGQATFICNEAHEEIPLATCSVDLICCFDVVEHIPDMASVASEWQRVLRPGGAVWIWWSPWRGPYGHHLESLIPLPWIHLLVPERVMFSACADLYDARDYVPRKWDIDPATGKKKPNKWRGTRSFYPFLNRLTRRRFERIVRAAGLEISCRRRFGFSGSTVRRATRALLPVPLLGECVTSFFTYELSLRS